MSALGAVARGIFAASVFWLAPFPLAIAHTDLELQIEALSEQLEAKPNDPILLLKRGDLYRRHEDYALAAADFSAARDSDPANPEVDFYQGRLALETGDSAEARSLLTRYVGNDPDHAAAWVTLGHAQFRENAPDEAANSFAQGIQRSQNASPELYRLQALALVASDQPDQALSTLDGALQVWPDQVNLLGLACDISLVEDLPQRARGYLDRLPDPLFRIDQWKQRANRAECLFGTPETSAQRDECLARSRLEIENQMSLLVSGD